MAEDHPQEVMAPTDEQVELAQAKFTQCVKRLARIREQGFPIEQDGIISAALIAYLFGGQDSPQHRAFEVFQADFYERALGEIENEIDKTKQRMQAEYTRQQLLSGVRRADLRFPGSGPDAFGRV